MISKKLGIENAKKYTLCTTRGFVLNDKETLASYGLGSLLKNWQLKVVLKRVTNLVSPMLTFDKISCKCDT